MPALSNPQHGLRSPFEARGTGEHTMWWGGVQQKTLAQGGAEGASCVLVLSFRV